MAVGFGVYEDSRKFESKLVSRHTSASFEYPCIVLYNNPDAPIRKYMLEMYKNMNSRPAGFNENSFGLLIHLYINQDSKLLKLGTIQSDQVKSFLRLFEGVQIKAYYDKETELIGDLIYALAE